VSVAFHPGPLPVLRWSPTKWRKAQAVRDRVMRGAGTDEPWFTDDPLEVHDHMIRTWGIPSSAIHWRKPLRIDEVARMAPTPEVKEREGRG
jgi:hypothetical protein